MTGPIENDAVCELLGAYLDGELNAKRRAWVEYHLARCALCRHELEELRNVSSLLHADPLPVSQCSADQFLEQVMERLAEAIERTPPPTSPAFQPVQVAPDEETKGNLRSNKS